MHETVIAKALTLWGMPSAEVQLAAARENTVYRVHHKGSSFALRLRRQGYRSRAEIVSELEWMNMLSLNGISVPAPVPALNGEFCHGIDGIDVDLLYWLEGEPMGRSGVLAPSQNHSQSYRRLGQTMAHMHACCDTWILPDGFVRPDWNLEGLLGNHPLWGRFWDNPSLSTQQAKTFMDARDAAIITLRENEPALAHGLIHADLVPGNVLVHGQDVQLIDFDDGGFGFRLYDLATTLNRAKRSDKYVEYQAAFLDGYLSVRQIDVGLLPLFQAIRALTYVGWIVPRMDEPGSPVRNQRFIDEAMFWIGRL